MEYKCKFCKDTHFITSKKLSDGTEVKCFCYCHPLVRNGALKPLDGNYAFEKLRCRRKKRRDCEVTKAHAKRTENSS